jgi:hypothetical protein
MARFRGARCLRAALVYGVAFANILQGVSLAFDHCLRPTYSGSFSIRPSL